MTTYSIETGNHKYVFSTDIPKEVLEIFVEKAVTQARYIYDNWHRGASQIYGDVIRVNPSNYVSIFQAGKPSDDSLDEWVKSTALKEAGAFIKILPKLRVSQNDWV